MTIVNSSQVGFYTDRIGSTDDGVPVYLYFDPLTGQFRPVIVPSSGNPYYADPNARILHDTGPVSPIASAVVLGTIGAILGGGLGAAIGATLGVGLSRLTGNGEVRQG